MYIVCTALSFFFFSSRRRHTRFKCDWSSDVCSSDLRCHPRRAKGCWIRDATAARRAALRILRAVRANATFQAARDRAVPGLEARDRRLANALAAGVPRRQADLDRPPELRSAEPRRPDR